jgi:hypothetical protein
MFDDTWRYVEVFTIRQAAALWSDEEPLPNLLQHYSAPVRGRINANTQFLYGAILRGELEVDHSTNGFISVSSYEYSTVTREELVRFARLKERFPAFLFDTIAPEPDDEQEPGNLAPKKKRGRPAEYDYDLMYGKIVLLALNGNLPNTQAQLVQDLLLWFTIDPDDETMERKAPSERLVEERVKPIYNTLKRLGWPAVKNPTKSKA